MRFDKRDGDLVATRRNEPDSRTRRSSNQVPGGVERMSDLNQENEANEG